MRARFVLSCNRGKNTAPSLTEWEKVEKDTRYRHQILSFRAARQACEMIPMHGFTVARTCAIPVYFFVEWQRAGWNMTCFDNRQMQGALVRHGIPIPPMDIQKADVARFVLLYELGGMYVDADVLPIRGTFVAPESYLDPKSKTVFGYEAIVDRYEQQRYGIYRPKSLCMWTVLALPRASILLSLARNISANSLSTPRRKRSATMTRNEYVHKTTGPTAVTDFMLPRLHIVAPVRVFGCGQTHSNAGRCLKKTSFCRHGFAGTWRTG